MTGLGCQADHLIKLWKSCALRSGFIAAGREGAARRLRGQVQTPPITFGLSSGLWGLRAWHVWYREDQTPSLPVCHLPLVLSQQ